MANLPSGGGLYTIAQRNLRLLETGDYSDFLIECGQKQFKVHRNIVCPQSPMLATLCNPVWKEGTEGRASLNEEDPEVVEQALRFLYAGSYDRSCPCRNYKRTATEREESDQARLERWKKIQTDPGHEFVFHVRLYILGDYLDVGGLRACALEHCKHQLDCHSFDAHALVEPFALAFAKTKSSDPGLRTEILQHCVHNSIETQSCPSMERLMQTEEPLAWPLLLEAQRRRELLAVNLSERDRTIKSLEANLTSRTRDLERAHENLKSSVKLANQTKQCRNETCDKEFGAALETYANGYIKSLRCKRCNCRHMVTQA